MKQVAKLNYEYFFSKSVDLLCIIARGGIIKHMNSAWCDTFGYALEELIGQNCYEFLHPQDLEASKQAIINARNAGVRIISYVNRFRHKDGHYLYVEWQCLSKDDKTYCTVRDMNKLKSAEEQLLQEQNRLQAIMDSQNKYLIRLDLDLKITYANKKFVKDFNWFYQTTELIGISIFSNSIESKNAKEKIFSHVISIPNQIYEYEEALPNAEGQIQYLFWQCICLVDEQGKPLEIQCIALDITARKLEELEEEALKEEHFFESTIPISTLWNGILLLPLVGTLNAQRAQFTMNTVLNTINQTQAKILILDISGISMMDTTVANYIFKIVKSTKLMGCETNICGITPAVAQTMISLGIDLQDIHSTGSLQNAIEKSLQYSGFKLSAIL